MSALVCWVGAQVSLTKVGGGQVEPMSQARQLFQSIPGVSVIAYQAQHPPAHHLSQKLFLVSLTRTF